MTDHSTTALGDMLRQLADDLSTHENLKQRVVELEQLLAERPEAQEEAQQEVSLIEAVLATRSAIAPLSKPLSERVELLGAALDAATTRASELEADKGAWKASEVTLAKQRDTAEKDNHHLYAFIQNLHFLVGTKAGDNLEDLRKKIEELKNETVKLKQRVHELEAVVELHEKTEAEISKLQGRIKELEAIETGLRADKYDRGVENNELKKLLEKTEAQENASLSEENIAATTRASELEAETVNLRKKIEELEAETVNVAMHHRAAELYAKFLTDKNAVQVYLQGTLHDTIATLSKRVDVTEARIDRLLEGMAAFKDVD